LLREERENLRNTEDNWQSFVISALTKSPIITDESHFYYSWRVVNLPGAKEISTGFCTNPKWLTSRNLMQQCKKEGCWDSQKCELDAVLKDKNGRWQAIFEYEDAYDDYCEVLCRVFKVMKWLKSEQKIAPILYLFYWIPSNPKRNAELSKTCLLRWYVPFIKKHFYSFRGLRTVIVLQSGPNNPPYAIIKTKAVTDDHDFSDLQAILSKFP